MVKGVKKMDGKTYLGKRATIEIDRPLGSKHPRYDLIYPVNYGFIPETVAGDGKEIDVYLLGVFEPLQKSDVEIIALIERMDDIEFKLVAVQSGKHYSVEQIYALVEFQERFFKVQISQIKNGKVVTFSNY
ncbi:MAG: inorganic diphosphatase [Culicoidibacterales bacterium]